MDVARSAQQGRTTVWTLLTCSLYLELRREPWQMALQVKSTLTRFPTNHFYTPMDSKPFDFILSVCRQCVVSVVCFFPSFQKTALVILINSQNMYKAFPLCMQF